MTGEPHCNYRTVLLMVLVLNYTLANLSATETQSPASLSSSSYSSSPSSSPSTPPQHPPAAPSSSSPSERTLFERENPRSNSVAEGAGAPEGKGTRTKGLMKIDRVRLDKLEEIFLKRSGLQRRPTLMPEYAVPDYMLDLYRDHASSGYLQVKGHGPVAANTVRSFVHKDHESHNCGPPLCSRLHFDVSPISDNELLAGAEFRVFVSTGRGDERLSGNVNAGALAPRTVNSLANSTAHRIEIYEIIHPETSESEAITRLLDTRVANLTSSGWESFDIHPAVLKWKKGINHGLEVRLVSRAPVLSTERHVRLRRSADLKDNEWALQRPLLVTYTDDLLSPRPIMPSTPKLKTKQSRKKRDTKKDENRKNKKNEERRKQKKKKGRKGRKNICKRHNLYVNFDEVGWNDWIVAPDGYNAYYCHGECMAPLPDFAKASNHAMLQARVYKVNPQMVPMVCCVPMKMSPMSMLYRDEQGRTILKVYQDMSVEECGCK